jgi:hypothetical protein
LFAIIFLGARHRHQMFHRGMGADPASANFFLNRVGQFVDQRKAA